MISLYERDVYFVNCRFDLQKDELDEKSKEFIRLDYRQSSIVNRNHDDLRTQRVWKPGCSGITFRTVITRPTHTQNEPSESGTAITPNPATNCGRALLGCVLGGSPILPNIPPRPVHMVTKASDNPDIIQPIPRYPTNPIASKYRELTKLKTVKDSYKA